MKKIPRKSKDVHQQYLFEGNPSYNIRAFHSRQFVAELVKRFAEKPSVWPTVLQIGKAENDAQARGMRPNKCLLGRQGCK